MGAPPAKLDAAAVFDAYRDRIHRHIRYLVRDREEAQDLTQETFLRAHAQLASLEDPNAVAVWLYRIATRVSLDALRRTSRAPLAPPSRDEEPSEPVDEDAPSLQQVVEQAQMSSCVRGLLDRLSPSYRAVLLLHDLHGLTGPELAARLGCTLATVKIRLHRARRRLQAALHSECALERDERGVLVCEPKGRAAAARAGGK